MAKTTFVYNEKKKLIDSLGYLIMYLMVGFIPHIYRYATFAPAESESIYYKDPMYVDLYMLAKSRVFLFLTVLLLGVFAYQVTKKHIVFIKDKIAVGTGAFALVVILSSVMSDYQDLVYWGAKDRFEGMWVWLAYLVLFTVARHYGADRAFVERALKMFVFSASVMAVFGLMQVFGYDIYTAGPLRWICFPREVAENMATYMVTNVTEVGAVGALFNSNYFGVYVGLAALISLGLTFLKEEKNLLFLSLSVLLYSAMIASKSEAALLGFATALFLFMMGFGSQVWQKKQYLAVVVLAALIMDRFLAMNLLYGQSGNALWIYLIMIIGLVVGLGISLFIEAKNIDQKLFNKYSMFLSVVMVTFVAIVVNLGIGITGASGLNSSIEKIIYSENLLVLENVDQTSFGLEILPEGLNAYDQDMTLLEPEILGEDRLSYVVAHNRYTFEVDSYENGVLVSFEEPESLHMFYDGQTMTYVNPTSGFGQIESPDRIDYYFEHGSAFTNRGYLWSTYLPIVKDKMILGQGLETYLSAYPQNDYLGKTAFYVEGDNLLIDKPHSLYIDVLFGMGILGGILLIVFVVFLGDQYFTSISVANNSIVEKMLPLLGISMMLIAGIFNDSVIPLTILFSCFGGMGLMSNEEI